MDGIEHSLCIRWQLVTITVRQALLSRCDLDAAREDGQIILQALQADNDTLWQLVDPRAEELHLVYGWPVLWWCVYYGKVSLAASCAVRSLSPARSRDHQTTRHHAACAHSPTLVLSNSAHCATYAPPPHVFPQPVPSRTCVRAASHVQRPQAAPAIALNGRNAQGTPAARSM